MEQEPAARRPLTLDRYDFYVARARAERAQAIADFFGLVAGWSRRAAARLMRRDCRMGARRTAGLPTPR